MTSVSVVIPTYNGRGLLEKHLPSLLRADGIGDAQILIVDDGSNDGTAEWLAAHYARIDVVRLSENGGFSRASNAGLARAEGEYALLLNNDVQVEQDFLPPLIEALDQNPSVFAVNSSILIPGKENLDEGRKTGAFHHGIFYVDVALGASRTPSPTLYATACSGLYRLKATKELGGFDELLSPFYWEDADLSYRALRRGWQALYEPRSIVHHQHESTTSRLDPRWKNMIRERNQFLFVWKNMTDRKLLLQSRTLGFAAALHQARDGRPAMRDGYLAALRLLPLARKRRLREGREALISDQALLARFSGKSQGREQD